MMMLTSFNTASEHQACFLFLSTIHIHVCLNWIFIFTRTCTCSICTSIQQWSNGIPITSCTALYTSANPMYKYAHTHCTCTCSYLHFICPVAQQMVREYVEEPILNKVSKLSYDKIWYISSSLRVLHDQCHKHTWEVMVHLVTSCKCWDSCMVNHL